MNFISNEWQDIKFTQMYLRQVTPRTMELQIEQKKKHHLTSLARIKRCRQCRLYLGRSKC